MNQEMEILKSLVEPQRSLHGNAVMPADVSTALADTLFHLPDGILLIDREWRITYANAAGRRISRLQPNDLNGPSHWELFPATVGTEIERQYRRVMQERVSEQLESFYAPFQIWVKLRAFPSGEGIAVLYEDVTELHQLQAARAAAVARELQVMSAVTDAVLAINRDWFITYMNGAARQLTAASGDVLGRSLYQAFPFLVYENSPYVEHYFRAMTQHIPGSFEATYPEPLNVTVQIQVRPSDDGIVLFVRDVTQQRKDEQALRESEERYRALTELGLQCIWTGAPDGHITYANQRFLRYIGESFRPGHGNEWLNAFYEEDRETVIAEWKFSLQSGHDYNLEARLIRAEDGAVRWFHLRAQPLRSEDGSIRMWMGVAVDIHDRRSAVEGLRALQEETERQRAELEAVYDTAPVGLALFEPKEFRYLRVSKRQAETIGLPQEAIVGRQVQEITSTDVIPALFERVRRGEIIRDQQYTTELPGRPGETRSFNVSYSPVLDAAGGVRAISGAVQEVTHLRRAEEALIRSEKLAAVGRLASSISHEINNPLEAVTNLLYLIATEPDLGKEIATYVQLAQDELRRVSQIATQTLRFHRQANSPAEVTPAALVDPVLNLFAGRLYNSGIQVKACYATSQRVLCFENDIRQVLNNLIGNAIDAMRNGGQLHIRAHRARDPRSGFEGIRIAVADTGYGMSEETRGRIFEPFYTTKGLNGNGLGLWISQGIVERHQGQLRVRSSQKSGSHGTVFTLFLPSGQEPVPAT